MSDKRAEVLKRFSKEFGRTEEGFNKKIHSYVYNRFIRQYVYDMKLGINMMAKKRDTLVKPDDPANEAVEDLVSMFASNTGFKAMNPATSDYHAKILRLEEATKIFQLNVDLNLPDLPKTVIPFDVARKTIIREPQSLAVIECPCRTARGDNGCYPRDVCLLLGEPWVSFALEFGEDVKARRITQEEAIQIIQRQHDAGNVHAIFYKGSQNDRTYCMCNCCSCCCAALQSHNWLQTKMFGGGGYKCELDQEACISCGSCTSFCNFFALELKDGELVYDVNKCMGCGACVDKCPSSALSLRRDDPAVCEPLDMDVLIPLYTPSEAVN
jgi:ferredoxin